MGQNATYTARSLRNRPALRGRLRRFVGSWTFTPLMLALVLSVVFSAFGYRMQQRESEELHGVFAANLSSVTRVLEVASEHALRDGHHRDLRKIILSVAAFDEDLGVLVTDDHGELLFSNTDASSLTQGEFELIHQTLSFRRGLSREHGRGMERVQLITALLDSDDTPDAVLVVRKPMRELERDLAQTRSHAIWTTLALALFTLVFGLVLAHLRVRRPLRTLRELMDGLADVEGMTSPQSRGLQNYRTDNEVAAVANAFRELMDRLGSARASVEALHIQRENLTNRLADSSGRAKLLQFSSEIAHEIGSPLQVILGRAAMLEDRADRPEDVRRHAGIVVEETQRIQRIVQRSLKETTDLGGPLSTIDLGRRARDLAELSRGQMTGREVEYLFDFPKAPVTIRMDEDALDQILRNLLANAHAACDEKGVVRLRLEPLPEGAKLTIRDTGVGMDAETAANALAAFFSTRPVTTGHGFGLPIVQRLCRDFGVSFDLDSELGVGTTVTLVFSDTQISALWDYNEA